MTVWKIAKFIVDKCLGFSYTMLSFSTPNRKPKAQLSDRVFVYDMAHPVEISHSQ